MVKERMKRVGYIYDKICTLENIREAIIRASERKRHYRAVKRALDNIDEYAEKVQKILLDHSFVNSSYIQIEIYEKLSRKKRLINKPPFYPDQIVHWALMLQIQPILMRGMDRYCSGNVPGRGEKRIRLHLKRAISEDPKGTKYYLKYDVKQFYPSIDRDRLRAKLRRVIKDEDTLALLDVIIGPTGKGLPIGTYTAQWLANFYLQGLDHYTREKLGVKYMVRYVDDVVILGPNKRKLFQMQKQLEAFLNTEELTMKNSWIVIPLAERPIDVVGYRFYGSGRVDIRPRIFKNARRLMLRIIVHGLNLKRARAFMSYNGYIKNSNSYEVKRNYVKPLKIKQVRQCVSKGGKI